MAGVTMYFHNQVHNKLKPYIRYYWYTKGFINNDPGQQLLPMDHSDLVVQCSGGFAYLVNGEVIRTENVVFHGLRREPIKVFQGDYCEAFGVSFEPWGLYPFIRKNMAQYTDHVVNLSSVDPQLKTYIDNIMEPFRKDPSDQHFGSIVASVEELLLRQLTLKKTYLEAATVFEDYTKNDQVSIASFCEKHSLQRRTFERNFKKYIGVSPKEFQKIRQFEDSSRALLHGGNEKLTDVALDNDYYDQAHFVRTFKAYTHHTPSEFKKEQPALKAKMKYESED